MSSHEIGPQDIIPGNDKYYIKLIPHKEECFKDHRLIVLTKWYGPKASLSLSREPKTSFLQRVAKGTMLRSLPGRNLWRDGLRQLRGEIEATSPENPIRPSEPTPPNTSA